MPEIKAKITDIMGLETRAKIVDDKADGTVVDRHLITAIKFEAECRPDVMAKILWALKSGQQVSATFTTPQLDLGIGEEKVEEEPVEA